MAQLNTKFQVKTFTGMSAGTWAALTAAIPEPRRLTIQNPDIACSIMINTDQTDLTQVFEIGPGQRKEINLWTRRDTGFVVGDTVLYLLGPGAQPNVTWEQGTA